MPTADDDPYYHGHYSGHPGLNWYSRVTKTYGRDLQVGQWLDSLDHSGARTIHSITTDLATPQLRTVAFSDIPGDCEVVRVDVEYDVVDPTSHVAPDGTLLRDAA